MKAKLTNLVRNVLVNLWALYRAEPVRVNAQLVNLVVLAAAHFNVVIDPNSVWQILGVLGFVTGLGELTRKRVTPA